MLNGIDREVNFTIQYFERQPYLISVNPTEIVLSNHLTIIDGDAGPQYLVEANVTILEGKPLIKEEG